MFNSSSSRFFGQSAADVGPNRLFYVLVKEASGRATAEFPFVSLFLFLSLFVELGLVESCLNLGQFCSKFRILLLKKTRISVRLASLRLAARRPPRFWTAGHAAGDLRPALVMMINCSCEPPPCYALPKEQSTPGFSNSRICALPHVHLRSPGSRPSSLRGPNE